MARTYPYAQIKGGGGFPDWSRARLYSTGINSTTRTYTYRINANGWLFMTFIAVTGEADRDWGIIAGDSLTAVISHLAQYNNSKFQLASAGVNELNQITGMVPVDKDHPWYIRFLSNDVTNIRCYFVPIMGEPDTGEEYLILSSTTTSASHSGNAQGEPQMYCVPSRDFAMIKVNFKSRSSGAQGSIVVPQTDHVYTSYEEIRTYSITTRDPANTSPNRVFTVIISADRASGTSKIECSGQIYIDGVGGFGGTAAGDAPLPQRDYRAIDLKTSNVSLITQQWSNAAVTYPAADVTFEWVPNDANVVEYSRIYLRNTRFTPTSLGWKHDSAWLTNIFSLNITPGNPFTTAKYTASGNDATIATTTDEETGVVSVAPMQLTNGTVDFYVHTTDMNTKTKYNTPITTMEVIKTTIDGVAWIFFRVGTYVWMDANGVRQDPTRNGGMVPIERLLDNSLNTAYWYSETKATSLNNITGPTGMTIAPADLVFYPTAAQKDGSAVGKMEINSILPGATAAAWYGLVAAKRVISNFGN